MKTTDQGLSITGLITLILWCFDRWNFTWKLCTFCNFFPFLALFVGIIKCVWQPKTSLWYVLNLKVMVVLKTADQGLSRTGLLTLLSWCSDWWNFTWKQPSWHFSGNGNQTDWSGLHQSYVNAAVYFSNIYNQGELMCKSSM